MLKSPLVEKAIPVTYDIGSLALADTNPLELENVEQDLYDVTRDNVQLLVNQLLQLPLKKTSDSVSSSSLQDSTMVLFQLPEPIWQLPREKPVPKVAKRTRWEEFAAKKGIQKKAKDGKLVYDEETQKWVPKWGYGGINKKLDNQWLVEVDDGPSNKRAKKDDELVDPRSLSRQERKRLVKKNQVQQKRNAKAQGV